MLEYIRERLPEADDYTLEQIYDFLQEVEYWKEVIRYLIHGRREVMPGLLYKTGGILNKNVRRWKRKPSKPGFDGLRIGGAYGR